MTRENERIEKHPRASQPHAGPGHCARCCAADEECWSGWYGEHDPEVHSNLVAREKALNHILDELLESDDWETDAAFWFHRLSELESRQS